MNWEAFQLELCRIVVALPCDSVESRTAIIVLNSLAKAIGAGSYKFQRADGRRTGWEERKE